MGGLAVALTERALCVNPYKRAWQVGLTASRKAERLSGVGLPRTVAIGELARRCLNGENPIKISFFQFCILELRV